MGQPIVNAEWELTDDAHKHLHDADRVSKYRISAAPLHPILPAMERKRYVAYPVEQEGRLKRRIYWTTLCSVEALRFAQKKVRELVSGVVPNVSKA